MIAILFVVGLGLVALVLVIFFYSGNKNEEAGRAEKVHNGRLRTTPERVEGREP